MTTNTLRIEFQKLVAEHIHRKGIDELLNWLDTTDFYTAPASTKYHNAIEGGLCDHSIKVFKRLMAKREDGENIESLAIVSLFHDLCKIGLYEVDYRNFKNERGQWEKIPYYKCNETFPLGHGEKSLFMIQRYIPLTDDEALAVRWHMGGFGILPGTTESCAINGAMKKSKMVIKLQEADVEASYWDEPN